MRTLALFSILLAACGPSSRNSPGGGGDDDSGGDGGGGGGTDSGGGGGGGSGSGTQYVVYAHSDTVLYSVDLDNQTLVTVGDFNSPNHESMTDLAVGSDGTIYVISETYLYTASATTGQLTELGPVSACGEKTVALTTTSDGGIWAGDYAGALCPIDVSVTPPTIGTAVTMSGGMALTGDFVGVDDGTIFGTAFRIADGSNGGSDATEKNNLLVKIDLTNGTTTVVGSTGFPDLYGVAFQEGKVFGFTHDGTGRVVTIDQNSGAGTLYATFTDSSGSGIAFGGAGVNALVPIVIQ